MTGLRVLSVEGGYFDKYADRTTPVAFLFTEGIIPRKLTFRRVKVDGLDATEKLSGVIEERLADAMGREIDAVMSSSVPIAGFNLLNARKIFENYGIPTIFVLAEKPDEVSVRAALLKHFVDWRIRLEIIEQAGVAKEHSTDGEQVLIECVGMTQEEAFQRVRPLIVFGKLPEPIRIARMACRAATSPLKIRGS
jgi:endonuclease V-like protein UPF0215 family